MNVNKININQSEQTYYIATDIYDVSARNNGTTFESLSALLSDENLSTLIPSAIRCGGMTICFIQSSDNKYVQYRLMSNVWSNTVADWQGVDDEPTSGSDNLVKSGGVADKISELKRETETIVNVSESKYYVNTTIDSTRRLLKAIDKHGVEHVFVLTKYENGICTDTIYDKEGNVISPYIDENNIYIYTIKDKDGRIVGGIRKDGVTIFFSGIVSNVRIYEGKKWVVVGDSLTDKTNDTAPMRYFDYISLKTGISIINHGKSGTGYARDCHTESWASAEYLPFYQRINLIQKDCDVITIFGSGNDLGTGLSLGEITDTEPTSICGCINKTFDAIFERFPMTPLGVITPTPWDGFEPNDTNENMKNYCDALIDICQRRGIPYLDLYRCSNLHPSNQYFRKLAYYRDGGNGVHPDENGHAIIAPRINEFLKSLIM